MASAGLPALCRTAKSPIGASADRFGWCARGLTIYKLREIRTQRVVGTAELSYVEWDSLNARARSWKHYVKLKLLNTTEVVSVTESIIATKISCGGGCNAPAKPILLRYTGANVGQSRTLTFPIASPGRGTDSTSQTPVIDIENAATPIVAAGRLATLRARCDSHRYVGYGSPGCVNAGYTPTDVIPATLGQYANHVAWAEVNLKHHWGWKGHGPSLHRANPDDLVLVDANRNTACPPALIRPAGEQCDEYPFASTLEGASRSKPDYSQACILAADNSRGGVNLKTFYQSNRVLSGDGFWVSVQPMPSTFPFPPTPCKPG